VGGTSRDVGQVGIDFRSPAPQRDIHKSGFINVLALFGFATFIDGQADLGNRCAAGSGLEFNVTSQIAVINRIMTI
jgi:hypothetical protein